MVAPLSYWAKTYGGKDWDGARAVAVTPEGDIIVAGYTWSFGAGGKDVWVLRLDGGRRLTRLLSLMTAFSSSR